MVHFFSLFSLIVSVFNSRSNFYFVNHGVNIVIQVGGSDAPSTELRMSDVGLVGTNPNSMSDEDEEEFEQKAELAALQVRLLWRCKAMRPMNKNHQLCI